MNFDLSEFLKYFKSLFSVAFAVLIVGVILLIFEDFLGKFLGIEELLKNYKGILGLAIVLSLIVILAQIFEFLNNVFQDIRRKIKSNKEYKEKKSKYRKKLIDLPIGEKYYLVNFLLKNNEILSDYICSTFDGDKLKIVQRSLRSKGIIKLVATNYILETYRLPDIYWEIIQENPKEIFYEDEFKKYFIEEKES
ncbi:hypothetical protein [Campylobacter lari]|uniref:hypothetical protein n=1 Tax=Campylobacter lari TaxID=201 RepID=UPI0012C5F962|nr:hypothetical protein [Campylobacter lari]MBT0827393.1 hypothetical protein [Campylobacter lari]MCR6547767.1 hypothetical protein [Campylobacter lari]